MMFLNHGAKKARLKTSKLLQKVYSSNKKYGMNLKNKQKVLFFLVINLFFNHSNLKSGKQLEKRLTR